MIKFIKNLFRNDFKHIVQYFKSPSDVTIFKNY